MNQVLYYLYISAGVVFLFGAAIFVHEFGHFWVARKRGLKVEEFAIGFGPKIVSWKRDGIDYSLRWIPAGGFVRLPQMMTSAALEGGSGEEQASATGEGGQEAAPLPNVSALSKILVAVAGPAMNVIFAFVLATVIYFVGLPVPVNPPIIGYVDPKSHEGRLGIHDGDRIVAIDGKPVKSWDDIFKTTILALTNVFQVTIVHEGTSNAPAGGSNVYALTASINDAMVLKFKTLNLEPRDHLVVGEVNPGTPAAAAQLKVDDELVSFAGTPISSQEQFTNLVQAYGGKATPIVVKRGDARLTLVVTSAQDQKSKRFLLGIKFGPGKEVDRFELEHPTPLAQVREVWEQLYGTVTALVHSHESGVKASDLSGPVGIASMLALQVKSDYRLALHFLVMLNINLAILNLLPIPVLDGGHVVMAILERIRRRPLEVRVVEYTTTVFAVLIISFMLYVTFFDIRRIPLIRMLSGHKTEIVEPANPGNSGGPAPETQPAR
jgi:regulator of sigma E protease